MKHREFPLFDGIKEHKSKIFELFEQYVSCYNDYKKVIDKFTIACQSYKDQLDRLIESSKKSIPSYQSRANDLLRYAASL